MSFTNINDPAGVAALLEKLRSSQAWADLQNNPTPGPSSSSATIITPSVPVLQQIAPHKSALSVQAVPAPPAGSSTSVAALLSQLTSATPHSVQPEPPLTYTSKPSFDNTLPSLPKPRMPVPTKQQNVRGLSFQQALPHLARLSENPKFVEALSKMREEQNQIERQLWEERQVIRRSQEEKVKVAVTKASMLGTGITEREASGMTQNFIKELRKFDKERVLPAWDGLITTQQAALEALGVPVMFVTTTGSERERQKRVLQVLEGLTNGSEN